MPLDIQHALIVLSFHCSELSLAFLAWKFGMQQTIIVDIHTMLTLIFPKNHIVFALSLHQPFPLVSIGGPFCFTNVSKIILTYMYRFGIDLEDTHKCRNNEG